jgi:site-specific DNA-methyltransferase (adenine-specific)
LRQGLPRRSAAASSPLPRPVADVLHGDCLDLVPQLGRRFACIYVDPPFNTGVPHRARRGAGARATGAVAYDDGWGGLDAFLSMLEPRLAVLRDALGADGSLWLHLDHRTVHDAKVLCDRVFGRAAFRGEVIWVPGNGARGTRGPSVTHQSLLLYAPSDAFTWNGDDPALREPHAATSLAMHFTAVDTEGRRYRDRTVNGKTYRYYADRGRKRGSVWTDLPAMRANTPLFGEATGYPTQKPLALLDRVLRASTRPGDAVLDPMCGSGTTLVAARTLGLGAVGIDRSELAVQTSRARLSSAT